MSIPIFFPVVTYVKKLVLVRPLTLRQLCQSAGVACKASGAWAERQVEIVDGETLQMIAEPGDWGAVQIRTSAMGMKERAQLALAALAYGMHDLVAKQSILMKDWSHPRPPRGRPKMARALSVRERQQRFRQKMQKK